jgi:uncharacterized OB-fold protein
VIICSKCGAANKPGMDECRMCSSSLTQLDTASSDAQADDASYETVVFKNLRTKQGTVSLMECLICPDCQTVNHLGWLFCPQCGRKVDASFLQTMQPSDQAPTMVGTMATDQAKPQVPLQTVVDRIPSVGAQQPAGNRVQASSFPQQPPQSFANPQPHGSGVPEQPPRVPIEHSGASANDSKSAARKELNDAARDSEGEGTACSECGSQNAFDYSFCLSCGAPLPATKTVVMASIASPARARLRLLEQGGEPGCTYPIRNEVSIGRTEGSITFPRDSFMSSSHARIVKRGPDFVLIDEASSNGTFMKVKRETKLEPGDVILVGQQLFRFEA